jgi:hypothetical protein
MPIGSPNAGYLTFETGQVLTAAQVQYNLQNQTIMYFASAAARDAVLLTGIVQEGMFAYLADTNSTTFYNGTTWENFGDVTNGTLTSPKETVAIVGTGAATTVNIETQTASVEYITANATANWTTNVTGSVSPAVTLNSTMAVGEQISVVLLNTNGATAYYPTAFNIDGTASGVTLKWLGGTAPSSGNINSIDAYVYTIIKTASATYTVLASQNKFA